MYRFVGMLESLWRVGGDPVGAGIGVTVTVTRNYVINATRNWWKHQKQLSN